MKTVSALGNIEVSEELFNYLKDNVHSLQELYKYINEKLFPNHLFNSVIILVKSVLYKHVKVHTDLCIYPLKLSNYCFSISKDNICMFGLKQGLLDVRSINQSVKQEYITKSVSNQYVKDKKPLQIIKPNANIKDYDLSKLRYGTKEWFDAFYSDTNWSPDDIKLGVN